MLDFYFFNGDFTSTFPHMLRFCICSKPVLAELRSRAGASSMAGNLCSACPRGAELCHMRHGTEHAATLGQRVAILFTKKYLSNSSKEIDAARAEFKITARTCYPLATSLDGVCFSIWWRGNRPRYTLNPFLLTAWPSLRKGWNSVLWSTVLLCLVICLPFSFKQVFHTETL